MGTPPGEGSRSALPLRLDQRGSAEAQAPREPGNGDVAVARAGGCWLTYHIESAASIAPQTQAPDYITERQTQRDPVTESKRAKISLPRRPAATFSTPSATGAALARPTAQGDGAGSLLSPGEGMLVPSERLPKSRNGGVALWHRAPASSHTERNLHRYVVLCSYQYDGTRRAAMKFQLEWFVGRWNERLQRVIAWHSPRWLIRWAVCRAYAKAWADAGNKTPDELTYTEVYKAVGRLH